MTQKEKAIEIPFGAKDSELLEWVYYIPEGMEAEIKDRKVIIKKAESEDERIRKVLIDALKTSKSVGELKFILPEPTREECIAYLEKQKEQKPWKVGENTYFTPEPKSADLSEMMVHKEPYIAPVPTPIVADEQKPAEGDKTNGWTGVDLERYLSCLQRLGTGNPQQPETINSKWFKEHCHPQPNQEWGEEDEKIRQKLIRFISSPNMEGFMLASDGRMFVSWLKSLRHMPKVAVADGTLWKPSEEQMGAVKHAYNSFPNDCSTKSNLKLLYHDLEKLM